MRRWRPSFSGGGLMDAVAIIAVIYVTLASLHPNLIFSSSLLTGGDTGAHLALPAFLRSQHDFFNLTPWYPGWFAGMPAYTYYFVLPDYLATLASYVIGFAVAFKLATVLGSVLMPLTAYALGRLFRAPRPIPAALALATLPFLFDASFTIDGGNLFSTMAGEYAFSFSLAFALLSIGLFARGVVTGRGYWLAAISLSITLAGHVLPYFFVVVAVIVLVLMETMQRRGIGDPHEERVRGDFSRPWRFGVGAGLLSAGLSAWWLLPFGLSQQLTNSMGYVNDNVSSLHATFTTLGWYNATGGAGGDRWVITLATLAFVGAFIVRDRLGMFLGVMTLVSLAAFVLDPQSVIWNERLVPFWFISIHLAAGWLVGYPLARWANRRQRFSAQTRNAEGRVLGEEDDEEAEEGAVLEISSVDLQVPEAVRRHRVVRAGTIVLVLGLLSTVPGLVPSFASAVGLSQVGNQVSSWAEWNYSGYQGKAAWPEYHDLMTTMAKVGQKYGCGRAMWEYNASENRFGTPMALMLMPYWTNNCVDSMEGLYFESSATTPYHFLNQAELSAAPSNPQVGLPYGSLNVTEGVEHLQMLGVRYYVAFSPLAVAEANSDPQLRYVAETRKWPAPGVQWRVYLIKNSPVVEGLSSLPNVLANSATRVQWLNANVAWWTQPKLWGVLGAASGPANWPRVTSVDQMRTVSVKPAKVSDVQIHSQSLSFHVSHVGTPVLVKVSFYPRWHAQGADGPYRVSPNLMAVIPTSHDVTLVYGSTPSLSAGNLISAVTILSGLAYAFFAIRRRRRAKVR